MAEVERERLEADVLIVARAGGAGLRAAFGYLIKKAQRSQWR